MRVLVASAFRPPWELDLEDLSGQLEVALQDHGHEVESIRIPFGRDPDALWTQLFALRMTNVSDVGELLVATSAPCHLLRHRHKVLWMTEHYPWLEEGSAALESLRLADRRACEEASAAYAVSQSLRERIARPSASPVEVLPPPLHGSWDRVIAALTESDRGRGDR